MKIFVKGLILIGVPLIAGIVFISTLFWGISQTNRLVSSELMVKDTIISFVTAARCSVCAVRYWAVYNSTQDKNWLERAKSNEKLAAAANAHLETLHKANPSLPIPSLLVEQKQSVLFEPNSGFAKHLAELSRIVLGEKQINLGGIADLTRPLQDLCDQRAEEALNATWYLRFILYGGIFAEFIVSIALTVFFCVSITNALKKILNNTQNLARGLELTPPLKSGDEIAELDRFVFKSAAIIRELERFKADMVGIVGQELKSPLSLVGHFLSEVAAGMHGALNAKAALRVENTCNSVKRLITLISDLLFLDRLELRVSPKEIAVDELLSAAVNTIKELAERSEVEIAIKSDGGRIFADRDRLIQVLVNLLSNALKFSPPKGRITVETIQHDGWFECRISDQGPGIPESFRKQIFEPFKQVDAKDARAKKGTGLGLTISSTIVEQHGGSIGVDSTEGEGSTFWFRLANVQPSSSSAALITDRQAAIDSGKIPKMRFSVLKQGLLIISAPLVFQLVFVSMLGSMLEHINKQNQLEELSQKVLMSVNQSGDDLLEATRFAMVYMYTKTPIYLQLFETELAKAVAEIDKSKESVADKPDQMKDLQACRDALARYPANVQEESSRLAEKYGHDHSGSFASMSEFMDLIKDPEHPPEALLNKIHVLVKDRVHLRAYEPFFDAQDAMERVIVRENSRGKELSSQREQLLSLLNITLLAGIGLVSILSILLANFLMKNLIARTQHVMKNTGRIVERETLEAPRAGADEIAYLDQVLFETGNRILQLEAFKQALVSIVSHELRTPLAAVNATIELLDAGVYGELSDTGKRKLKVAEEEGQRLIRLINDLLDIEKMEAGKFVLDKVDFSLGQLIEPTTAAVAPLAEAKHIKLEFEHPKDMQLCADLDRLSQALVNLLTHEIRSSPENSTINLQVQRQAAGVEFRVSDQSGGIPEELREKMFDRFVQVKGENASVRSGDGLALSITKAIVEQHGGTIGVESEIGSGSTFWIKLPFEKS